MIYVEFMKNVFLADSSEQMGVRHISVSSAQKRLIPTLQTSCTSNSWKNFFWPIRANWWVLDSFRRPDPKKVWIPLSRHDVYRVHEKFFSPDSSELMRVRLTSASWAQKRFIPTLHTSCTSNSWKKFFSLIPANWWVLDSFSPPEPKNVWFLLSRHDVRRVHEKLFLADTSELLAVLPISASWGQKRLIPTLQTSCTSNSWKNFFRPIRANWWVLDLFRPPEPKNVSFLLSRHDVRRIHAKCFSRRFERTDGC